MNTSWLFPPSFNKSSDAARTVSEEPDIAQSVAILLQTAPGERFLLPEYGVDWHELLFEAAGGHSNSLFNPEYLKHRLGDTLAVFEPRVELEEVQVTGEPHEGKVTLDLVLRVKATGKLLRMEQKIGG
ncbi:GPW/gp25 family protein [Desulfovibrio cuneatus]|uniref:GPW/gp25 family protein n=1 Tax=Desulfovibrio cuneatus TaxID=159728 RepID=UPI000408D0C9|nr:GPW/gp25 family protein [Desulfovibrio cuneatus]